MRPRGARAAGAFLAGLVLLACGDTTAPPGRATQRGPAGAPGANLPSPTTPTAPPETARRPTGPTRTPPPAWEEPRLGGGAAGGGGAGASAGRDEEDEEASLARMLQAAFGSPVHCISEATRDRLEGRLTVSVTARVMPSGRVLDASVASSALSAEDLACMRQHAQTLRVRPGIEGTPRAITTSVEYEVQDRRVTTTTREPGPRNAHPGTLSPDRTLEAAGTVEDRPTGSVAPDHTLPAQGADERPPGFVPPSSTLPAVAE